MGRQFSSIAAQTLILAAFLFAPLHAAAQSNVILVCDGPECDLFTSIPQSQIFGDLEAALDAAINLPNVDTVQILDGTWPVAVLPEITKPLLIEGLGAVQNIRVQKSGAGAAFRISSQGVRLDGFTIDGGDTSVFVMSDSDAVINRCYLLPNNIGVDVNGSATPTIVNTIIANGGGGAIHTTSTGMVDVLLTTLTGNDAGIVINNGASLRLRNTNIAFNDSKGIEVMAGGTISGNNNNVHGNGMDPAMDNYIGTAPLASDLNPPLGEDPTFQPSPPANFIGILDPGTGVPPPNPLIGAGANVSVEPFVGLDIEGDPRPFDLTLMGNLEFDIGADEATGGNVPIGSLVFIDVEPKPIGRAQPGELQVVLRFVGGGAIDFAQYPGDYTGAQQNQVIIVPEAIDRSCTNDLGFLADLRSPNAGLYAIPMNVTRVSDDVYIGTNAVPIDELPVPTGQYPANTTPTTNPFYFDGLGTVVVILAGTERCPPTQVFGQAVDGRRVLIDTQPPVMRIFSLAGDLADVFVPDLDHNDFDTAAQLFVLNPGLFPAGPNFPANWPATARAPISSSTISTTTGLEGAKIFFNRGTALGFDPPPPPITLDFGVEVNFSDNPPELMAGMLQEVAGFDPNLPANSTVNLTFSDIKGTTNPGYFMPIWSFETGANLLPDNHPVEVTFVGPAVNAQNGEDLTVRYQFRDVPYNVAINTWHMAVKFAGIDAAGNFPMQDELLDPLHIWWLLEARTQLSPFLNTEVERPSFTWNLKRSVNPGQDNEVIGARPVFAFRLFESLDDRTGPYVPVSGVPGLVNGWSNYRNDRTLPYQWFVQNGVIENLSDTWLLLVVVGADEAGNVERVPWTIPGSGLIDNGNGTFSTTTAAGENWQRFLIPSLGAQLDTRANALFWHENLPPNGQPDPGEATFPQAAIIPLPPEDRFSQFEPITQRVEARFRVTLIAPPLTSPGLVWELLENGRVIIPETTVFPPANSNIVTITIPGLGQTEPILGDITRQRPVNYVFRAATTIGTGLNETDNTPVNYPFTVAPDVPGFIENKTSPDEQPVKEIESN